MSFHWKFFFPTGISVMFIKVSKILQRKNRTHTTLIIAYQIAHLKSVTDCDDPTYGAESKDRMSFEVSM